MPQPLSASAARRRHDGDERIGQRVGVYGAPTGRRYPLIDISVLIGAPWPKARITLRQGIRVVNVTGQRLAH
jgi:hypothetical protein